MPRHVIKQENQQVAKILSPIRYSASTNNDPQTSVHRGCFITRNQRRREKIIRGRKGIDLKSDD